MDLSTHNLHTLRISVIVILLFCAVGTVISQEFAPLGATWTYEVLKRPGTNFPVVYRYTSDRDTLIDNRNCRIIKGEELYQEGRWAIIKEEIVSGSRDSVYVYVNDSFNLIFNFSAEAGDTLRVIRQPFNAFFFVDGYTMDSLTYRIDSIRTIYMDGDSLVGDSLQMQYVSYLNDPTENSLQWGFQNLVDQIVGRPGRILQGVGSIGRESMLGTSIDITYSSDFIPDDLTCYQDPDRSYFFSGTDCEALIDFYTSPVGVVTIDEFDGTVYPNPFSSTINIAYSSRPSSIHKIVIRDLLGHEVAQYEGAHNSLTLSHLSSGTYQLYIVDHEGRQSFTTILKF